MKNFFMLKKNSIILRSNSYIFFFIFKVNLFFLFVKCFIECGIALCFNQIGLRNNIFILAYKKDLLFINSKIFWLSNDIFCLKEGCLSIKNKLFLKLRSKYLVILSSNSNNKTRKIFVFNFLSVCFQHEIFHLLGRLISFGLNNSVGRVMD